MNFQGYNSVDRPTSKVINPPGGHSNNIFGVDEPVATKQHPAAPIHNSPNMPAAGMDNHVGRPKNAREGNNIFGEQTYNQRQNQSRTGYNTITGECYDAPAPAKPAAPAQIPAPFATSTNQPEHVKASEQARQNLHTSSRVLAPPGGHSTKLW